MSPLIIAIAAFVAVAGLVGGLALIFHTPSASRVEDRLDLLTGLNTPSAAKKGLLKQASVLAKPLDAGTSLAESLLSRFGDVGRWFEQADTSLTVSKFLVISLVMGALGAAGGVIIRVHSALLPVLAVFMALMPAVWVWWRRRRRLKAFAAQLPDAMDMLSRALRAGQSLPAGFNMVASEMSPPICKEFGRVFEEQNLGRSMEEALDTLTERVPNLDLKFFATALVLQRQTGGDLAEILDKIGRLIRERFQIWGQIQALTGEGRLSGIVLLALPFALFLVVYQLNPDYVMLLFSDPMGKKMLGVALLMQVFGALVIRKIVNIKV